MKPTLHRGAALAAMLLVAGPSLAQGADCPRQLRLGMINYAAPPLVTDSRNGPVDDVPGQLAPWLRKALARSGCRVALHILRLPVPRGYEYLKSGEIDVWAPGTASAQALEIGVLPMRGTQVDERLGYARFRYFFYVPKGESAVRWDGKALNGPPGYTLGISNATVVVEFAQTHGWLTERAPNTNLTIDKLLARRFPVALVPEQSMQARPEGDLARLDRLEPAALDTWFQAVFSKPFAAKHPQFTRQLWLSLCQASRKDQPELPRCTP